MEEKKKKCKHCKEEIDAKAKVCPHCRKKQSNPILTVIIVLFVIGALGSFMGKGSDTKSTSANVTPTETVAPANASNEAKEVETNPAKAQVEQTSEQTPQEAQTTETMGQKNALSAAKNYLSFAAFSHSGLIKQLEFENYSTEDATYAANNCGADWNEQAAKSAENYLSFTSFSRSGLIDQLKFEGFTAEQAEYGVKAVGY